MVVLVGNRRSRAVEIPKDQIPALSNEDGTAYDSGVFDVLYELAQAIPERLRQVAHVGHARGTVATGVGQVDTCRT